MDFPPAGGGYGRSGRDPDDRVRAEHGFEAALQAGLQGHLPPLRQESE